ncbi:MAG: hypothetical protein ACLGJC_09535 [Alphaproteobacteria bacterium]
MSLSDYDLAKTERLYAHHRNMNTVARILGITAPAVSYRLKKAGVAFDARPRPQAEEAASQRARKAVWSPSDIYQPEA